MVHTFQLKLNVKAMEVNIGIKLLLIYAPTVEYTEQQSNLHYNNIFKIPALCTDATRLR